MPYSVTPVYVILTGELQLDAPVEKAWPHVVNYPSWQSYLSIEHISGTSGEEGELVLLRTGEAGFSFPPYYARTIKVEPERRLIWKTYAQSAGGEMEFFGIVDLKLQAENDKTRLRYDTLYEFQVPNQSQRELEAFREKQYRDFETVFASVFLRLKTLVQAK